ncbi:MAG: ABC transporter ATP-binding protein, partial [Bacteroidetes bacterium]|nr:ABC transporter ATP-binding protein [Bacteroidota bacterium]
MFSAPILSVQNLSILFPGKEEDFIAVDSVSFSLSKGEVLGISGASGSGKTITALALMGLAGHFSTVKISGKVNFISEGCSKNLISLKEEAWKELRGRRIAMVFQNPGTALNPVFTCGNQLIEAIQAGASVSKKISRQKGIELLKEVGFSEAELILEAYPHQLSGGQKQRVMIAIAMAANPEIIIADEPTSSLDEESSIEIMELFKKLVKERQLSLIMISHDVSVLESLADNILLMSHGKIVEKNVAKEVLIKPLQDYGRFFSGSSMVLNDGNEAFNYAVKTQLPILELKGISKSFYNNNIFSYKPKSLEVLKDISISLFQGETLGLVGPSGCGKTTLVKIILRLLEPSSGKIIFNQKDISEFEQHDLVFFRRQVQVVFQDPYAVLNPRYTVGDAICEPLLVHKLALSADDAAFQAIALLEKVGLNSSHYNRFPHELSGGQRQRINIARALAFKPKVLICDEPTSSLDAEIQGQVISLLHTLKKDLGLSLMFISHNLPLIRKVSDRIV